MFECVIKSPADLALDFAARVSEWMRASPTAKPFAISLTGGSVATTFFPVLAGTQLAWDRIEWFWGDERAVPPMHRDSNYRLAAELLFSRVPVIPARIHRPDFADYTDRADAVDPADQKTQDADHRVVAD